MHGKVSRHSGPANKTYYENAFLFIRLCKSRGSGGLPGNRCNPFRKTRRRRGALIYIKQAKPADLQWSGFYCGSQTPPLVWFTERRRSTAVKTMYTWYWTLSHCAASANAKRKEAGAFRDWDALYLIWWTSIFLSWLVGVQQPVYRIYSAALQAASYPRALQIKMRSNNRNISVIALSIHTAVCHTIYSMLSIVSRFPGRSWCLRPWNMHVATRWSGHTCFQTREMRIYIYFLAGLLTQMIIFIFFTRLGSHSTLVCVDFIKLL